MRKLRLLFVLSVATILMLYPAPSAQKAQASGAYAYEETYYVYYSANCSPVCDGWLYGEWTRDCEGNMTGWGWEPGHSWSRTEVVYGPECRAFSPTP